VPPPKQQELYYWCCAALYETKGLPLVVAGVAGGVAVASRRRQIWPASGAGVASLYSHRQLSPLGRILCTGSS